MGGRLIPPRRLALVALGASLALAGCQSQEPSRYLERDLYTLAVLPPTSLVEQEGAAAFIRPHVERTAQARGYRVLKASLVDAVLSEHSYAPADPPPPGQLAQWLDVDGVITTVVHFWGVEGAFLGTKAKVEAEFLLHDRSGELIWRRRQWATRTRKGLNALKNLRAEVKRGLCVTLCEQAFRRLKLAGHDPARPR